jgi:hypothetical protein
LTQLDRQLRKLSFQVRQVLFRIPASLLLRLPRHLASVHRLPPNAADYPLPTLRSAASTPELSPQRLTRSQHFSTRQHLITVFFGNSFEPPRYLSNVRCRRRLSLLRLTPAILRFPLNTYDVLLHLRDPRANRLPQLFTSLEI